MTPFGINDAPLIGICGGIGCGKSTVADILIDGYDFTEKSFADKLKRMCIDLFQMPERSCYGTQAQKLQPIPHLGLVPEAVGPLSEMWAQRVGQPWCGRFVLEYMGTEACRMIWGPVWVEAIRREIMAERHEAVSAPPRHVISDVRFQNEADAIKELGGVLIRVEIEGGDQDTTGHASDTWYPTAYVDLVIEAPKPGMDILDTKTQRTMQDLMIMPKVVSIDSGRSDS